MYLSVSSFLISNFSNLILCANYDRNLNPQTPVNENTQELTAENHLNEKLIEIENQNLLTATTFFLFLNFNMN
ncbi:hypothetical protein EHP00_1723 [Ecytonucleospora hepatopenaei]|uniref:Uncharacterized protein n=1 Tax=Ecytonucleospora hepatopenaei TaxID=646526 RepID=A0A1W0E6C7_9MICR|nr:hypothetical protein EHP00_1723 [Ecytonucleospora hepatopenaei]